MNYIILILSFPRCILQNLGAYWTQSTDFLFNITTYATALSQSLSNSHELHNYAKEPYEIERHASSALTGCISCKMLKRQENAYGGFLLRP